MRAEVEKEGIEAEVRAEVMADVAQLVKDAAAKARDEAVKARDDAARAQEERDAARDEAARAAGEAAAALEAAAAARGEAEQLGLEVRAGKLARLSCVCFDGCHSRAGEKRRATPLLSVGCLMSHKQGQRFQVTRAASYVYPQCCGMSYACRQSGCGRSWMPRLAQLHAWRRSCSARLRSPRCVCTRRRGNECIWLLARIFLHVCMSVCVRVCICV